MYTSQLSGIDGSHQVLRNWVFQSFSIASFFQSFSTCIHVLYLFIVITYMACIVSNPHLWTHKKYLFQILKLTSVLFNLLLYLHIKMSCCNLSSPTPLPIATAFVFINSSAVNGLIRTIWLPIASITMHGKVVHFTQWLLNS